MPFVRAGTPHPFSTAIRGVPDGTMAHFQINAFPRPAAGAQQQAPAAQLQHEGDIAVTSGRVNFTWTTAGPPTDRDNGQRAWRVSYTVTVEREGQSTIQATSQEIDVYHDWVEVKTVKPDASAWGGVLFDCEVKVSGRRVHRQQRLATDATTGLRRVTGLPGGDVVITVLHPHEVVGAWQSASGCNLRAEVRNRLKASFLYPAQAPAGRPVTSVVQYVNLAQPARPSATNQNEGRKIRLKLKLLNGKRGDKIYLKLEYAISRTPPPPPQAPPPAPGDPPPPPPPANAPEQPFEGLNPRSDIVRPEVQAGTGITIHASAAQPWAPLGGAEIALQRDGEEPIVQVELGVCADDEFIFKTGHSDACEDGEVRVTNKRRLYYQIMAPQGMTLGAAPARDMQPAIKTRMVDRMASVGVEWVHQKTHTFTDDKAPAGSLFPAAYFPLGGAGNVYVLTDRTANFTPRGVTWETTKDPRSLKLRLCNINCFFDPSAGHAVDIFTVEMNAQGFTVNIPDTIRDSSRRVFLRESAAAAGTANLPADGFALHRIAWRATVPTDYTPTDPNARPHPGLSGTGASAAQRTGTLVGRAALASLVRDVSHRAFTVNLPRPGPGDYVGALSDTKCPIEITITLEMASLSGLGLNQGTGAVLAVYSPANPESTSDVLMHEVGHQMAQSAGTGMAGLNALPAGLTRTATPGGTAYFNYGHQGPHCAWGISGADRTTASNSGPPPTWRSGNFRGTCIMFGANSRNDPSLATDGWCPDCTTLAKSKNITDIVNPT